MLTKQEVQHIAKLARLGLIPKEIEKMREELSSILDYIDQLKEVNISNVRPTSHSVFIENVTREDEARSVKREARRRMIEQIPEIEKGFVKVKSIL